MNDNSMNIQTIEVNEDNFDEVIVKLFGDTPVYSEEIYDKNGDIIEHFVQIKRTEDDSFITIVTKNYEIIQHNDLIVPFIKSFVNEPNTQISVIKENHGRRNRMVCKIVSGNEIINDELYKKIILISNTTDATGSKKILAGLLRAACLNMQFSGVPFIVGNKKHIIGSQSESVDYEELSSYVSEQVSSVAKLIRNLKAMIVEFPEEEFINKLVIDRVIPKKLIQNPIEFFESRGYAIPSGDREIFIKPETMFDIYQIITSWISNLMTKQDMIKAINTSTLIHKRLEFYLKLNGFVD